MKKMRQLIKAVLIIGLCAVVVIPMALWAFILEDRALVTDGPPPSPEDVRVTREFVQQVRAATTDTFNGDPIVRIGVKDLNSMLRLGARFLKGLRSHAEIVNGDVVIAASLPTPWFNGQKWLNASAQIPPLKVSSLWLTCGLVSYRCHRAFPFRRPELFPTSCSEVAGGTRC